MPVTKHISLNKLEMRTLLLAISAVALFVLIQILSRSLLFHQSHPYFLGIHTILELFSVFVAFSIFFQGWLTYKHVPSKHRLIVSLIFLQVGMFDLFHTLVYKGMPFFQDTLPITKATWLWILARVTESIGLTFVFLQTADKAVGHIQKHMILFRALGISLLAIALVILFPEKFPALVIEGEGVTPLKVFLEYLISLIHLAAIILIFKKYIRNKNADMLVVISGLIFLLLGELVFTLYKTVYGLDNLLGHVYKFLGYFYLMRGIFFPQYNLIFEEMEMADTKRQEAEKKLIENEKNLSSLIIHAQEEERKRVSRELHDGIGQGLYSILVSLRMFQRTRKSPEYIAELRDIEEMAATAMGEVKRIAAQLRPSALDDLGLVPAMRSFSEQFEKTHHIEVSFNYGRLSKRLTQEIETAIYRIFQESMNNAAKYSKATNILVDLVMEENSIILYIRDNGIGFNLDEVFNKSKSGIGLYSMQERAQLVNGRFFIHSEPGIGTQIEVEIPVEFQEEPQD